MDANKPTNNPAARTDDMLDNIFDRVAALEQVLTAIGYDSKASKKRRATRKTMEIVLERITKALCVETVDPYKENRVRFYHPLIHDPKMPLMNLPFAGACSAMGGFDDCGLNWVPPAGSTLMIFFEGGALTQPYYIGTTWHRNRGPGGRELMEVFPSREYQSVYIGHRKGYLVGPNDESQVLPPWNTESMNGYDIDDINKFHTDSNEQKHTTYPNIYGFKTPEKHMFKMVDGDAKCNRRWKRIEIMSGCGNWMIFKDDHLHYGGQWAHPSCPPEKPGGGVDTCSEHSGDLPYFTDFHGKPIEKNSDCGQSCDGGGKTQCGQIIGGHSSTPGAPPDDPTKYYKNQGGSNPYFKHQNECRPYRGPGTPQNNRCQLPQSGIQFLSLSGHTFVMDDSVEEPRGKPVWERSTEPFDWGCNNKYLGTTWWKSATGHSIVMSDVEKDTQLRGDMNYIQLRSASGNKIELNDHTIDAKDCPGCPPNLAGEKRGIHLQSTSNHVIKMIDHLNEQCGPCRKEGGIPIPKATQAYIQIRSGYGLEMRFNDDNSQQETQQQYIQILNPQCVDPNTDSKCNSCQSCECRGPHFLRMQAAPQGNPGLVFLRAGGHSIRQTYDMDVVLVGDKECNPSDKFTYVSKQHIRITEDVDFRYSGELHIFFAEKQILLMAGRDCPPDPESESKCKGPCLYSVIVSRCPVICPATGIVHWTEQAMSERVFASAYHPCQNGGCKDAFGNVSSDCSSYEAQMAAALDPPECFEEEEETNNSEIVTV